MREKVSATYLHFTLLQLLFRFSHFLLQHGFVVATTRRQLERSLEVSYGIFKLFLCEVGSRSSSEGFEVGRVERETGRTVGNGGIVLFQLYDQDQLQ